MSTHFKTLTLTAIALVTGMSTASANDMINNSAMGQVNGTIQQTADGGTATHRISVGSMAIGSGSDNTTLGYVDGDILQDLENARNVQIQVGTIGSYRAPSAALTLTGSAATSNTVEGIVDGHIHQEVTSSKNTALRVGAINTRSIADRNEVLAEVDGSINQDVRNSDNVSLEVGAVGSWGPTSRVSDNNVQAFVDGDIYQFAYEASANRPTSLSIASGKTAYGFEHNTLFAHVDNVNQAAGASGSAELNVASVKAKAAKGNTAEAFVDGDIFQQVTQDVHGEVNIASINARSAKENEARAEVSGNVTQFVVGTHATMNLGSLKHTGDAFNNTTEAFIDGDIVQMGYNLDGGAMSINIGSIE